MYERITAHAKDLQRERRAATRDPDPGLPGGAALEADGAVGAVGAVGADSPGRPTVDDEWSDRTLDNCHADALTDFVLHDDDADGGDGEGGEDDRGVECRTGPGLDDRGGRDPAGTRPRGHHRPRRRRRAPRIEGRLVIDLATLRGEADHPCLLDGTPVPAQVGRRLARDIAHWRRMVTDPVDGHLLDDGRRTYLPEPLRTFVLERDRTCRNPWCDQPTTRCQLHHATDYPDGPSDTTNTGELCADCHRIKTDHAAFLDHSAPDGSATWRTAWGQTIPLTPTRYLDDGGTSERAVSGVRHVRGVLDRLADHPAPRSFAPPDDPGDAPPF